jgi:hypothetical protein
MYDTPFRSYDAQLGRFHQIDPLADLAPGINPYRFGFNNPISLNDPTGLYEGSIIDLVNDLWNRTTGDVGVFKNVGGIFEQDFGAEDEINFIVNWLDEWALDGGGGSSEYIRLYRQGGISKMDLAKGNITQQFQELIRQLFLNEQGVITGVFSRNDFLPHIRSLGRHGFTNVGKGNIGFSRIINGVSITIFNRNSQFDFVGLYFPGNKPSDRDNFFNGVIITDSKDRRIEYPYWITLKGSDSFSGNPFNIATFRFSTKEEFDKWYRYYRTGKN